MSYFPKKLSNLIHENNMSYEYLSEKTQINAMLLKAYERGLEPNEHHLITLSDFFGITVSELYFKNHSYAAGTNLSNYQMNKYSLWFQITLSFLTFLNICYMLMFNSIDIALYVQSFLTIIVLVLVYASKFIREVNSLLKVKHNYRITYISLTANFYIFLLYYIYFGIAFKGGDEVFIVAALIPIAILFVYAVIYLIRIILNQFNPIHLYNNATNKTLRTIESSYVLITTFIIFGSTYLWIKDFYTPSLSFTLSTILSTVPVLFIVEFVSYVIKKVKEQDL